MVNSITTFVDTQNNLNTILKNSKYTILFFSNTSSTVSSSLKTIHLLIKYANIYRDINFLNIDISISTDIAKYYNIKFIPTCLFMNKNNLIYTVLDDDMIENSINELLKN
jgi:thiol-disulfide isomerase/thioredoxin